MAIYIFAFVLIELGARFITGNWTESFLEREINFMKTSDPAAHDPHLGWVPRAGYSTNSNYWRQQLSITAEGLRSNGVPGVPLTGRPILAVGDSFTFGDQVADHETWPAHLEKLLQRPVLNGGVFAYGIDQMVLRARQLLPKFNPEWLVLSFIPDDVARCEFWMRGAEKPFFRLVDGVLRLENQPVPPPGPVVTDWFRKVFGHSWIIHTVKRSSDPFWFQGRSQLLQAHLDGNAVAAALLRQLADELAAQGIKFLIVAQADERLMPHERTRTQAVLAELRQHPVFVLDLLEPLSLMKEQEPARFQSYFHDHMTDLGNRYVAGQIAQVVRGVKPTDHSPSP